MQISSIRRLSAGDAAIAQQLISLWQQEDFSPKHPIPGPEYLSRLLHDPSFHVFVALKGDRVVGGVTAYELPLFARESTEMFLYDIMVAGDSQREGIARQLIEALKAGCAEKGISVIFVGTETDNEAAQALYSASGGTGETISWFTYELR